jgi:hypothetical protein
MTIDGIKDYRNSLMQQYESAVMRRKAISSINTLGKSSIELSELHDQYQSACQKEMVLARELNDLLSKEANAISFMHAMIEAMSADSPASTQQ